jgi:hypothetical protein
MKKPFRIICLLLIAGVIVVTAYKGAVAQSKAQSIVDVMNQNVNAARHSTQIRHLATGNSITDFSASQYVGELHKIDTLACPKEFQLAWLNYVHTWELEAQQTPGTRLGEAYLATIGMITHSDSLEKFGTRGNEAANATTLAWQNVEMVALKYDVRMKYQ